MRRIGALAVVAAMSLCLSARAEEPVAPRPVSLEIQVTINPEVQHRFAASFAVWVRDTETGACRTVFATKKAANDAWWGAKSRPAALPVWFGVKAQDPAFAGKDVPDAVTGATPRKEFKTIWDLPPEFAGHTLEVFVEANVSFDYNTTYVRKGDGDGTIPSAENGQPSVIWRTTVRAGKTAEGPLTLTAVGHGDVSGLSHEMAQDLAGITTAQELVSDARVTYLP